MSLKNAEAFYQVLASNQAIYEQYYKKCSRWGAFGIWNWDKTAIVKFASSLGYDFTESELDEIWFQSDINFLDEKSYLSNSADLSSVV